MLLIVVRALVIVRVSSYWFGCGEGLRVVVVVGVFLCCGSRCEVKFSCYCWIGVR